MLSCPFCQGELTEQAPQCPSCDLTLERATKILGPAPLLNQGLTDLVGALSEKESKRLTKELLRFRKKFEAGQIHVIIRQFQKECNLSTHLFWLFNSAGLSPQEKRNGSNHDILIGLDPASGSLGLMVGYGLEPFLKKQDLRAIIENAKPLLEEGQIASALQQTIHEIGATLQRVLKEADQALGLGGTISGARPPLY